MSRRMSLSQIPVLIAPHLESLSNSILTFKPFVEWKESLFKLAQKETNIRLLGVSVSDVDMFGSRIGFIKAKANVQWEDGSPLPGIVFLRGGSVSILVLLTPCDGLDREPRVILTQQPRLAIGSSQFLELPAGMLDASGDFAGMAAQELKEECGLVIQSDQLMDLTQRAFGSDQPHVYPSPGACDEFLKLFLYKKEMPIAEIDALASHLGGLYEHGERISLKMVLKRHLWQSTRDMKALSSLALYDALLFNKQL